MSAVQPTPSSAIEADIADILQAYDVGTLQRCWPASHGIENRNYFVQTRQDDQPHKWVLTLMQQAPFANEQYYPLLDALQEYGLPVAAPLANVDGRPDTPTADGVALLQPCLTGQHTINPTARQIAAVARFTARMHLTTARQNLSLPHYPRDAAWLTRQVGEVSAALPYSDRALLGDSLVKTVSLLRRNDVRALPQGMIHGDLFRDNVLFNEHGLTGVLDFHHASHGYWIYDLAVIANDWCNDAYGRLDPDRTTTLLRAYHQQRPLKAAELWFFSGFVLYAALSFWVSRLLALAEHTADATVRYKDPDEFKRIVANHASHAFYLDPRQLTV